MEVYYCHTSKNVECSALRYNEKLLSNVRVFLQWMSEGQTEASIYQQAENGKTELSLMHFTIKNPHWQPPQERSVFISHLKEKVHHDAQGGPSTQLLLSEAPLCTSLHSNESATGVRISTRV